MINLTKIQLRQLEKTGECWHIDPMEKQPILENDWYFYKNIKFNKKAIIEELARDRQYRPGQKVKLKAEWIKADCGSEISILDLIEISKFKKTDFESSETMPENLWESATIAETEKPIRVQDLTINQLIEICKSVKKTGNLFDVFKDYFNKKFAEPKAVKCVECSGSGSHRIEHHEINCPVCNGTGINHYVYYIYDEESKIMNEKLSIFWDHNRGEYFCKNKPVEIILNPWVEIIKIKRK